MAAGHPLRGCAGACRLVRCAVHCLLHQQHPPFQALTLVYMSACPTKLETVVPSCSSTPAAWSQPVHAPDAGTTPRPYARHPYRTIAAARNAGHSSTSSSGACPQPRKPRVAAVPRSAAAPPLPAAFAPETGRNSTSGEGAGEKQAPPVASSGKLLLTNQGAGCTPKRSPACLATLAPSHAAYSCGTLHAPPC